VLQPINVSYEADTEGNLLTIATIGNSILWWRSTLAVVLSLSELVHLKVIARKPVVDHPLVLVLLGYAALLLPRVTGVPGWHSSIITCLSTPSAC
jgi:hypothetical protein